MKGSGGWLLSVVILNFLSCVGFISSGVNFIHRTILLIIQNQDSDKGLYGKMKNVIILEEKKIK